MDVVDLKPDEDIAVVLETRGDKILLQTPEGNIWVDKSTIVRVVDNVDNLGGLDPQARPVV